MSAAQSQLETLWLERGVTITQIAPRSDGSIAPPDRTALVEAAAVVATVPSHDALPLSSEGLAIGELLGRGGMGEVRLATQRSLRRDVAVKTVLADESGARSAVLKEAWVGAALEHPNVVPVHTLARTDRGPAVVMKRIEGVSLTDVLREPEQHPRFRGDPLEASLRALASVCRAIELAHERGILHLDLKPDNVMLGRFGEVYVLDWGLAAALEHGPRWLPRASALTGIAGTPAYMAPELAAADAAAVGAHTDVYLLGGLLHTIVTGKPLHEGRALPPILLAAWVSAPKQYGPDVPAELVAILHRATHRDPEQRFPSARAFREAVEAFLRHRRADLLVRRAADELRRVAPLLASGAPDDELEPRLAEVELALEQARRGFSDHPQLAEVHEELATARIEHALARERPEAASAFVAQLRSPDAAVEARIEALRARLREREAHIAGLEAMSRELDLTLGSAARRRLFAMLGVAWLLVSLALGALDRSGLLSVDYRALLVQGGLMVAALGPIAFFRRRVLFQNVANRRLYGGLIFTAAAVELHWVACLLLDVPVATALAVTPLYYAYAFATLAVALDRRFFAGAAALTACAAASAAFPTLVLDIIGVGGSAAVALTLYAWRERPATRAVA